MGCQIPGFFSLVLGVFFELAFDIINKTLEISKVFPEKDFELGLDNLSGVLVAALVLYLF